jgi:hypothetical protein
VNVSIDPATFLPRCQTANAAFETSASPLLPVPQPTFDDLSVVISLARRPCPAANGPNETGTPEDRSKRNAARC